jgi:probable nitrogen fixation protein
VTAATTGAPATAPESMAMTPFLDVLARTMRAHDTFGAWESRSDAGVLAEMIITAEQRRRMPLIADVDDQARWRLDVYYGAVGLAIERRTGIIAQPMISLSREGFGAWC